MSSEAHKSPSKLQGVQDIPAKVVSIWCCSPELYQAEKVCSVYLP